METKFVLETEDFNFLEEMWEKYNVPEGRGIRKLVELILNEYKLR